MKYVTDGDYAGTFFHRSVQGFVIQGGGFTIGQGAIHVVQTDPPIVNEFFVSNTRGTLAMAKLGDNPNSATSQWFFNLSDDNAANLDNQNGGFTVFGRIADASLPVMDAIAAVPVYDASNLHPAFTNLPLLKPLLAEENFIVVSQITVVIEPGDADGSGNLGLSDAILALQVLTANPTTAVLVDADVDGDGRIGLAEAIFVMQAVADQGRH